MGVTNFEIQLLEKVIKEYNPKSVMEVGSQNDYTTTNTDKPPFASEWYKRQGLKYMSIDLAGDNNSYQIDLSKSLPKDFINYRETLSNGDPFLFSRKVKLLTDFGSSEHIVEMNGFENVSFHEGYINSVYPKQVKNIEQGYYNCWLNKHNLLEIGGIMINVNPMHGHWENHGYSYLGKDFYKELVNISGYELIETGLNGATGNWETGVNVYGVIKKISDLFPSFADFNKLPIFKS